MESSKKGEKRMPNIIIHEEVGYLLGKIKHKNSYEYYLGLLSPDSPNFEGFAPKEERWNAHVRRKNLQDWRNSLKDFYQREKNHYPEDFLLGYIIHILTDIIYDDFFYHKVKERILRDSISEEDAHTTMRNDMDKYFFPEYSKVKEILKKKSNTFDINNISKELMHKWKEKQISLPIKESSSKYIEKELIQRLTEKVSEELPNIVNEKE